MGKAQRLKAERRGHREQAAVRKSRRGQRVRWTVGLAAFAILAVGILPAAYRASHSHFLADTGLIKPLSSTSKEHSMEQVTIQTDKGTISVELNGDKAPNTVAHITGLIKKGFYNGLTFHRVVPGFVIQGGDPKGDGTGGSGQTIPFEKNDLKHDRGVIAMARSQDMNSADSQFYITLAPQPSLDGQYVVFGKVTSGLDVVDKITQGDKMIAVSVSP